MNPKRLVQLEGLMLLQVDKWRDLYIRSQTSATLSERAVIWRSAQDLFADAKHDPIAYDALMKEVGATIEFGVKVPKYLRKYVSDILNGLEKRPSGKGLPHGARRTRDSIICALVDYAIEQGLTLSKNDASSEVISACDLVGRCLRMRGLTPSSSRQILRIYKSKTTHPK